MAGAALAALSPYIARGYDHKFFSIDPCIPSILGYNRGMKQETKDELILATLATSPCWVLLGVIIFHNLPSWMG
jgi:hypothetical protein